MCFCGPEDKLLWAPILLLFFLSFHVTSDFLFSLFFTMTLPLWCLLTQLCSFIFLQTAPLSVCVPSFSLSLYSSVTELVLPLSSFAPFCVLTCHCIYWSSSVSLLSPSHQLCVEAPFSPRRESWMNRRAYWEQWESQSPSFVWLSTSLGPLLSSLFLSSPPAANYVGYYFYWRVEKIMHKHKYRLD